MLVLLHLKHLLLFWDESANSYAFLTAGSGLTIAGTTITASASGVTGTINEIAYFDSGTSISSLPVATYPSLTELSYVKGVTSAIQTQINGKQASGSYEVTTAKDATGGYAGLTLFKINFKNALNTITSFFTNANTIARTYTFPDKDGTVAMTSDITGTNSNTNTGDQTSIVGITGTMAQFDTAVTDGNIVYQSQALGTPASGTLTNATGLPLTGLVSDTTTALGIGSINLGHASDTTIARSGAGAITV